MITKKNLIDKINKLEERVENLERLNRFLLKSYTPINTARICSEHLGWYWDKYYEIGWIYMDALVTKTITRDYHDEIILHNGYVLTYGENGTLKDNILKIYSDELKPVDIELFKIAYPEFTMLTKDEIKEKKEMKDE